MLSLSVDLIHPYAPGWNFQQDGIPLAVQVGSAVQVMFLPDVPWFGVTLK